MQEKRDLKELEWKTDKLERDVGEWKKTEEMLRLSEKKYHSLVDTTSDWVWEVNLRGKYTYASSKVKDLLGYDVEEIVGAEIFSFMAEEEQASNKSFFKRMREMPAPFSGRHVTQIRKDGRRVIIEINGAPIYTKDGELSGFCGCDKDITRKVEAEDILRESEERYRNLFENTQAGVFRATLDGMQFLDVNRKFAEIFGFSTEEILNQPSPFNFSHSKEMIQMVHQVNKEGTAENHEIEAMTQDGRKITCLASVKYFPRQKYVEGTIVDISDRKKWKWRCGKEKKN